jgi:hypothetical protein
MNNNQDRAMSRTECQTAQQSLAHIFHATAAAAHEEFPRELERLVVLLVPHTNKPVYVSPAVAKELTKSVSVIRQVVRSLTEAMHDQNASGLAQANFDFACADVNLIALDGENVLSFGRFTKKMQALYALDHEIGHHILRNGFPSVFKGSPHLAESAADAFAVLRHIQRFRKNTDQIGFKAARAAASLVLFGDAEHYTANAVQRAVEVAADKGKDFFTLSLRETAELAAQIADDTHLDNRRLKKLTDAYQPVADYCAAHIGDAWEVNGRLNAGDEAALAAVCRRTLAVMRKRKNDADILKAGKQFLSLPRHRNFMVQAAAAGTGGYWKNALAFLDAGASQQPHSKSPGM